MRVFVVSAIVLLTFVLQSTVLRHIEIFGIRPNISLIIVVSFGILRFEKEGGIIGFFAGLLQDIIFGPVIGLNALLYMLIGYFSGKPFKKFYAEIFLIPIFLVGSSTLFFNIVYYILNFLFRARLDILYYFGTIILPETLYNVTVSLPVYFFIYVVNKYLEKIEKPHRRIFRA